jgi:hypothetical protein
MEEEEEQQEEEEGLLLGKLEAMMLQLFGEITPQTGTKPAPRGAGRGGEGERRGIASDGGRGRPSGEGAGSVEHFATVVQFLQNRWEAGMVLRKVEEHMWRRLADTKWFPNLMGINTVEEMDRFIWSKTNRDVSKWTETNSNEEQCEGRSRSRNDSGSGERRSETLQPVICRPESERRLSTGARPKETKQSDKRHTLQNGGRKNGDIFGKVGRLRNVFGHQVGIQSHPDTSICFTLFDLLYRWESICLGRHALWSQTQPSHLHESDEGSTAIHTHPLGVEVRRIYGRHIVSASRKRVPESKDARDCEILAMARLDSVIREVRIRAKAGDRIPRLGLEFSRSYPPNEEGAETRDAKIVEKVDCKVRKRGYSERQGTSAPIGKTEFLTSATGKNRVIYNATEQEESDDSEGERLEGIWKADICGESRIESNSEMGGKEPTEVFLDENSGSDTDNGCKYGRMGSQVADRDESGIPLRIFPKHSNSTVFIKSERDNGCAIGTKKLRHNIEGRRSEVHMRGIRQHYNGEQLDESEGSEVDGAYNEKNILSFNTDGDVCNLEIQTGHSEHSGRRTQQTRGGGRLRSARRGVSEGDARVDRGRGESKGCGKHRHVCHKKKCEVTKVRVTNPRPPGGGLRRIFDKVGGTQSVCSPSHKLDTKSLVKNRVGEGGVSDRSPSLDQPTMVAKVDGHKVERGGTRGSIRNTSARECNEKKGDEVATGAVDDDQDLLAEIKGNHLKPGVRFIIEALQGTKWRRGLIKEWFLQQSPSTTRNRLKAIALFGQWCMLRSVSPQEIQNQPHPEVWVEECVKWIYESGGSYTSASIMRTGVAALFRDWFGISSISASTLVSHTLQQGAEKRKPRGGKRRIWDVSLLLSAMKAEAKDVGLEHLNWSDVIGRVGIMLIIFTCCRVRDMYNISSERSVWRTDEGSMLVAMKTKTGGGRLQFKALLPMDDTNICPIKTIDEYRRRVNLVGTDLSSFFVDEKGKPIESSEKLSRVYLTPYIRAKGIPPPFTPYSAKTAVITALFNMGFSRERVSSYTGHSNSANVALKHYHDPTNTWLGHELGGLKEGAGEK